MVRSMLEYFGQKIVRVDDNALYTKTITLVAESGRLITCSRLQYDELVAEMTDSMEADIYKALLSS